MCNQKVDRAAFSHSSPTSRKKFATGPPAVAMAYLAEEIHPRALGATMGLYVGGTAFGGMMGRLGMGALTEFASWRGAMGLLGLIDLAAAIGFILLLPPSRNFVRRRGVNAACHL